MSTRAARSSPLKGTATAVTRAQKGAAGLHKKHPRGALTPDMLAASRANLQIARTDLAASTGSLSTGGVGIKPFRGQRKAERKVSHFDRPKKIRAPLGVHLIAGSMKPRPKKLTITGIYKRVPKRISPTSRTMSTGWKRSTEHRTSQRLHVRKAKLTRQTHWKKRNRRMRPR